MENPYAEIDSIIDNHRSKTYREYLSKKADRVIKRWHDEFSANNDTRLDELTVGWEIDCVLNGLTRPNFDAVNRELNYGGVTLDAFSDYLKPILLNK